MIRFLLSDGTPQQRIVAGLARPRALRRLLTATTTGRRPQELQRQVIFLRRAREFALCFHKRWS